MIESTWNSILIYLTYHYPFPNVLLDPEYVSSYLKANPQTKKVFLSFTGIDNRGAEIISEALALDGSEIEEIALAKNRIGREGAENLFNAVKSNGRRNFQTRAQGDEPPRLCKLNLFSAFIENPSGLWIQEALAFNLYLKDIDLSNNAIMDVGMKWIADGLKENSCLLKLNLASIGITAIGADHLAKALALNSTLEWIKLSKNELKASGFRHITKAKPKIQSLFVDHNSIDSQKIDFIKACNSLKNNTELKILNLGDNQIGSNLIPLINNIPNGL